MSNMEDVMERGGQITQYALGWHILLAILAGGSQLCLDHNISCQKDILFPGSCGKCGNIHVYI